MKIEPKHDDQSPPVIDWAAWEADDEPGELSDWQRREPSDDDLAEQFAAGRRSG